MSSVISWVFVKNKRHNMFLLDFKGYVRSLAYCLARLTVEIYELEVLKNYLRTAIVNLRRKRSRRVGKLRYSSPFS